MIYRFIDDRNEAREILTQEDDYLRRVNDATLGLLRVNNSNELVAMIQGGIERFRQNELHILRGNLNQLEQRFEELGLNMDFNVNFIKTNGKESMGMPYTRNNASVIPATMFGAMGEMLRQHTGITLDMGLLSHEIFHVFSQNNPEMKEELYQLWGFDRYYFEYYPVNLLVNPDAPNEEWATMVNHNGNEKVVVPLLLADPTNPKANKMLWDGENLIDRDETDYLQRNQIPTESSAYHPEEISAEAFRKWIMGENFDKQEEFVNIVLRYDRGA